MWEDLWTPLVVAAIAVLWPWLLTLQRGWRFQRLIKRELQELGPYPRLKKPRPDPTTPAGKTMSVEESRVKPWWEYVTKRFVHEETFRGAGIPENRDFILTLKPTLVYQVSQLWIALEKRDGTQWSHYLCALSKNRGVGSPELAEAAADWKTIINAQRPEWSEMMGVPTPFRQDAALQRTGPLFEKRIEAYAKLLRHLNLGSEEQPRNLSPVKRAELGRHLEQWFYDDGAGLLLSGRAFEQFQSVREVLGTPDARPTLVAKEASALRTDLKIDLGVRQPQERLVDNAWPEDERW